jgi:predicted MFS family arabinose efflux permease
MTKVSAIRSVIVRASSSTRIPYETPVFPLADYLRRLDPHLPRTVWLVQAGGVVNSFGNGVVFPFAVIYLHNVRGISFAQAGFALAFGGAAALLAGLAAGSLVDRIGGRNTLIVGLLLQAVAFTLFPLIREPWHAYALFGLDGVGTACFWPGQSTLLARLTPAEDRHSAYALQRVSMNLGIGLGGVVGGLIATTADPGSFTRMFLLDAGTFLVFAVILTTVREPQAEPSETHEEAEGYRAVLRDRNFLALTGLNVVFVAVGYEVFALLPPFAKNYAGVSERWVGFIWLANTLLIVLIQLPVSKALEGRRRMVALALMNVLWAAAALIVLAGGGLLNGTSAALVFMTATMVFAVGETLQGPTQAPLVADLAPDHLRGRYFAVGSMSWSAGSILGPAIGGPLLGWHPFAVWPIAAGVCIASAAGCLALERRLPPRVRRTPKPEPVAVTPLTPPLDLAAERL